MQIGFLRDEKNTSFCRPLLEREACLQHAYHVLRCSSVFSCVSLDHLRL